MKKTKLKHVIFFIGALAICVVLIIALAKTSPKITLFYGDTCPHCEDVEEYINSHDIEGKVSFRRLEVFNNRANSQLLAAKAASCGLDTASVGVPFVFENDNCYMGVEEVTSFFQQYE
jgi:glutaredoxin